MELAIKFIVEHNWGIGLLGLILNCAGAIPIAFSFGEHLGGAYNINKRGKRVYMASFLHPGLFKVSVISLSLGFLIQIVKHLALLKPS